MKGFVRAAVSSALLLLLGVEAVAQTGAAARPGAANAAAVFRTIVLVRHGHYAPDPAADPLLGPGLSPLGVAQARLVGARLAGSLAFGPLAAGAPGGFDRMASSPLQRARDTAASIDADLPGPGFELDPDLAECTPPARDARIEASQPPAERDACRNQLERLFTTRFRPADGASRTELYVCHGNVIRYLATRALGVDATAWPSMSVGHASVTRIRIAPDGSMQVVALGDVGHIAPNLQTGASGDGDRTLAREALVPAG